jgi:hypothetical protein
MSLSRDANFFSMPKFPSKCSYQCMVVKREKTQHLKREKTKEVTLVIAKEGRREEGKSWTVYIESDHVTQMVRRNPI